MQKEQVVIVWHKCTDLRLHDHETSSIAHATGLPVIHLFVFDPFWFAPLPLTKLPKTGVHRATFLLESVVNLHLNLQRHGQRLHVFHGPTEEIFKHLCVEYQIKFVCAFSEVCSQELRLDERVRAVLATNGVQLRLYWGFTLYHLDDLPADLMRRFPKTYSAFRRLVEERSRVRAEVRCPEDGCWSPPPTSGSAHASATRLPTLAELGLCVDGQAASRVDERAPVAWVGGEQAALGWVQEYIWRRDGLSRQYVGATNTMSEGKCAIGAESTTKLSPWLAHGCLSARTLHAEVEAYENARGKSKGTYWLKHELIWRDFLRFGALAWGDEIFKLDGIDGGLRGISWERGPDARDALQRWIQGGTGYPFVDAFMRELAATGYTTHCGRECACWFLVRDLALDWRLGGEYFESILIDYEPSANWGNWAYRIATTAPRAPPTFNEPVRTTEMLLWAQQHDPHALHVKRWLPELACLPAAIALEPWRLLAIDVASPAHEQPTQQQLLPPKVRVPDWTCATCTLLNAARASECEACGMMKPEGCWADFVLGQDYPMPVVKPQCVPRKDEIDDLEAAAAQKQQTRAAEVPLATDISINHRQRVGGVSCRATASARPRAPRGLQSELMRAESSASNASGTLGGASQSEGERRDGGRCRGGGAGGRGSGRGRGPLGRRGAVLQHSLA